MSNNNYMGKIDKDKNPKGINYFAEEKKDCETEENITETKVEDEEELSYN